MQQSKSPMQHPFILQPYNGMATRFRCPSCNKSVKTFSKYIDTSTGAHVNDMVGRCSREINCGYHYTPKQYFQDNSHFLPINNPVKQNQFIKAISGPPSYINPVQFQQTLKNYNDNNFVEYLIKLFGTSATQQLLQKYCIGTSRHWHGATIFWQIDNFKKIRSGKIMLYNPVSGKRVKKPYNHITWVHKLLNNPHYVLKQCLFGLHLLNGNTKPVAVVESEKTAIIASAYLPEFLWLATGSLNNLNKESCKPLTGCNVTLFPDLNGFGKWSLKADELSSITKFKVSNFLESIATSQEIEEGLDIADYLLQLPQL